jgi:hypothetical protein
MKVERKERMPKKSTKVFATGKVYWAKVVGDQALHQNYDGTGRQWSFEFEPEDAAFLKDHRLLDRLKDPMAYALRLKERGEDEKAEAAMAFAEGRSDYLVLKKPEFNRDGEKNKPFRIYDSEGKEWGGQLLGNGTEVDVKLEIVDWGAGKKKSIYCSAIRVKDLVPYEADEFAGMDNPTPSKPSATKAKPSSSKKVELDDGELDDDIPF